MTRGRSPLPSVDEVLSSNSGQEAVERHGRTAARNAVRRTLENWRAAIASPGFAPVAAEQAAAASLALLAQSDEPRLRRVFNLTGTILHTNLGRAVLAERAIEAVIGAMRHPAALEFDLDGGGRGERDDAVRDLIGDLTGAEDACIVNNNAAAVLLVLNTLSKGREAIVSRGELIEIGGSFRMPELMARAGAKLVEIGTTNRTHAKDYEAALGPRTGLILKVHTSNYTIQGFTKEVPAKELSRIARAASVPLVDDLGSGTLVDLAEFGLKREPTVQQAIADGADIVTFSGDKLLGGPQAGIIAGRKDLVRACAKNPLKRALRLDKLRLAALEATLQLYRHPEKLAASLPTLSFFTRPVGELSELAERIRGCLSAVLGPAWRVEAVDCGSQIGSGALPLETIKSVGVAMTPVDRKTAGRKLAELAAAFRRLPIPVVGHTKDDSLIFDLRCLDDEAKFTAQLAVLNAAGLPR
ncbi:MAG: L-seryl-tRNA(Sec) selenium transferase [Hyphomicrobiales bacterium]